MKKYSISFKMFGIFLGLVLLILLLGWVLTAYFLPDYYEDKKIETIEEHALYIQDIYKTQSEQTLCKELDDIAEHVGGKVLLLDSSRGVIYMTGGSNRGWGVLKRLKLEFGKERSIYKLTGQAGDVEWLVYEKSLTPETRLVFQIPFHSIREAIIIIQGFYGYIILAAIIVAVLLAFLFSKIVTKPLIRLDQMAQEIQKLNFSVKYEEKREDEIGHLGQTFNMMTEKLEKTIGRLEEELQKEKNLDRLRKQFVAQVSHELQTPISVIQGYAEALSDGIVEDFEEQLYYYDVIQGETHKMSQMIRDLLDLSQLESGVFKICPKSFDIIGSVAYIVEKYQKICLEKEITLAFASDVRNFQVYADEGRIEQVVTNFLNNAIRHTGEKGLVQVRVSQKGDKIDVSVFNTGEAIPPKDFPYIWQSFYKVKDVKMGTGLGLAICRNILELHQSKYYVQNEDDGVRFGFELKAYRDL